MSMLIARIFTSLGLRVFGFVVSEMLLSRVLRDPLAWFRSRVRRQ
jgi:hypothetical protein